MGHGLAICPAVPGRRLTTVVPGRAKYGLAWWLHELFEASLVIKALLAATEAAAGLTFLLTPNHRFLNAIHWLLEKELIPHRHDLLAEWANAAATALSIQTQHFYAIYLLSHGGLKLAMVLLLARGIRWAYPASMVLLALFILYQMNHWTHTHSPTLLILTAFDAVMIYLVWREYRAIDSRPHRA